MKKGRSFPTRDSHWTGAPLRAWTQAGGSKFSKRQTPAAKWIQRTSFQGLHELLHHLTNRKKPKTKKQQHLREKQDIFSGSSKSNTLLPHQDAFKMLSYLAKLSPKSQEIVICLVGPVDGVLVLGAAWDRGWRQEPAPRQPHRPHRLPAFSLVRQHQPTFPDIPERKWAIN